MKIVCASNNAGKITEINYLLSDLNIELISQAELGIPEVEETGQTFVENALIKARHASQLSGLPALADDSGICIEALDFQPGIFSARFAGQPSNAENNIQKVLRELKTIPPHQRKAFFYSVIVLLFSSKDQTPIIAEGIWRGEITTEKSGTQGFGYDPIFYDVQLKKTAAELPMEIKNKISHRGQALMSFKEKFLHACCHR